MTLRGYTRDQYAETQWRRSLDAPIPDVPISDGYGIRSLGGGLELL
jgi:hypothetical protein